MPEVNQKKAFKLYLLGELSEDERSRLEERLLADDDYFQQLLLVEEDLIDDYLSGELQPIERARFDEYFMSAPERQQDLRFAKAFRKYVATADETASQSIQSPTGGVSFLSSLLLFLRPPRLALLFSLIALAFIIGSIWLIRRPAQPESIATRTEPSPAPTPTAQPEPSPQPVNTNTSPAQASPTPLIADGNKGAQPRPTPPAERQGPTLFTVALASGMVRGGGEIKGVRLPGSASTVQFRLELDPASGDYRSYRAVLQTGSGREVTSRGGLRARATSRGKMVVWEIPAKLLGREDYYLRLSGESPEGQFESAGSYGFRVIE